MYIRADRLPYGPVMSVDILCRRSAGARAGPWEVVLQCGPYHPLRCDVNAHISDTVITRARAVRLQNDVTTWASGLTRQAALVKRPHLLDVIQHSTRIIHLAFKKQGGNFHVVGVYAPHSGLDLEKR